MSKNKFYVAMACAILAFTGCAEDDMGGGNARPAHPGEEIIFGGTLDSKSTRTVYGDKQNTYTEVKWVAGDGVRIYCAEALYQDADGNDIMQEGSTAEKPLYQKYCEYTVTDGVTGNFADGNEQATHSTGLKPSAEGGFGLRWGSNGAHKFYAVYPSKTQLASKDQEAANTLKIEGKTLTALLPNMQGASDASNSIYTVDNGNVTYYPAMRNAYMTAYKSSAPVSNLSLTFEPIVTAVEVTLQNNTKIVENGLEKAQDLELEMVTFSHPTAALCGVFSANLENKKVTNTNTDASFKTVSVPTKMSGDLASTNGNLVLKPGKTVTVTAFLALNENADLDQGLDQIKVSILANGLLKTATLKGNDGVKIVQTKKKNFISTVKIGYTTEVAVDYSKWVADLKSVAPQTTLGALSIPGAGGATSSTVSDATSRQQDLNIDNLWAQGIRCFEFSLGNDQHFGTQSVYCNLVNTGVTLNAAMTDVIENIHTSGEFAMVIITYQENSVSDNRSAGDAGFAGYFRAWCNQETITKDEGWFQEDSKSDALKKLLSGKNVTLAQYSPTMTLTNASNKLFIIGRPVAIGHDPGWYTGIANGDISGSNFETGNNAVINILGWGNNPDQWYARGFGNLITQSPGDVDTRDRVALGGVDNRPFAVAVEGIPGIPTYTYSTSNDKFNYQTTTQVDVPYGNSNNKTAWIQDWRRVVPSDATRSSYSIAPITSPASGTNNTNNYYYSWAPSEDEKWNDVITTLDKALTSISSYSLCINSLCGYFVDGAIKQSYQPRPVYQRYREKYTNWYGATKYDDKIMLDDKYRGQFGINLDASRGSSTVGRSSYGPYAADGGYKGNIGAYADWINNKFYNLLLQKQASGELTGKSAGIVMMDRVSNDAKTNEAGYYIPRIIISMNFSATEASTLDVKTSNLEETDQVLSRKNFSVTWDK